MNEQERLLALMSEQGLNAKDFAAEVGISAATMSNVINGRNKPSLEVLQKVLTRFRGVSSDWLILGIGSMYAEKSNSQDDNPAVVETKPMGKTAKEPAQPVIVPATKDVVKVLVFYSDGTFDELHK